MAPGPVRRSPPGPRIVRTFRLGPAARATGGRKIAGVARQLTLDADQTLEQLLESVLKVSEPGLRLPFGAGLLGAHLGEFSGEPRTVGAWAPGATRLSRKRSIIAWTALSGGFIARSARASRCE